MTSMGGPCKKSHIFNSCLSIPSFLIKFGFINAGLILFLYYLHPLVAKMLLRFCHFVHLFCCPSRLHLVTELLIARAFDINLQLLVLASDFFCCLLCRVKNNKLLMACYIHWILEIWFICVAQFGYLVLLRKLTKNS